MKPLSCAGTPIGHNQGHNLGMGVRELGLGLWTVVGGEGEGAGFCGCGLV